MNNRERVNAILHYEDFDAVPVVSFGFWTELLRKWRDEGHIPADMVYDRPMADGEYDEINRMLGFDFNWNSTVGISQYIIEPTFDEEVLEVLPNGHRVVYDLEGNRVLRKPGVASISAMVGHTLVDRESWEKHYLPRLSYGKEILDANMYHRLAEQSRERTEPLGLFCGSMLGRVRNWLGLENTTYLYYDDPDFFTEIVDTVGELLYRQVSNILDMGVQFDYAHMFEDICGNNGPLVMPKVLDEIAGPHYERITNLLCEHGVDIVSVDCDGCIDVMVPIWLKHGVNTMIPIEVGQWKGNIRPWREKYGRVCRGVGGMEKAVFAQDYAAIDAEIERLRPLVDMGGYLPCPDHRIPPGTKWENVQY